MAPAAPLQLQVAVLICILLCCTTTPVDADERPASITGSSDSGSQSWGYVEVRNKAHMFWFYHKSPHRVSSAEKPWRTLLYAAPACSKYIRPEGLEEHYPYLPNDESNWLDHADIIYVDTPVGTGWSYYDEDASPDVKNASVSEMGPDVVELLKDLAVQIPTLRSSPLILLGGSYLGPQIGEVSRNVIQAILQRRLNLKVGGIVFRFHQKATIMPLIFPGEDTSTEHEQYLLHDLPKSDDNAEL